LATLRALQSMFARLRRLGLLSALAGAGLASVGIAACSASNGTSSMPQVVRLAGARPTLRAPLFYYAVPGTNQVAEYPLDSTTPAATIDSGLLTPQLLAPGPNATLYVLEYDVHDNQFQIQEFASGHRTPMRVTPISGGGDAMAVDLSGNVYLAGFTSENGAFIREYAAGSGKQLRTITSKSFKLPAGLATDDDGNLFVADEGANAIFRVSAKTNAVRDLQLELAQAPTSVGVTGTGENQTTYVAAAQGVLKYLPGQRRPAQMLVKGILGGAGPRITGVGRQLALITHGNSAGSVFYAGEDGIVAFRPYATSDSSPYEAIWFTEPCTSRVIAVTSPR
jgi:hypothetical protein